MEPLLKKYIHLKGQEKKLRAELKVLQPQVQDVLHVWLKESGKSEISVSEKNGSNEVILKEVKQKAQFSRPYLSQKMDEYLKSHIISSSNISSFWSYLDQHQTNDCSDCLRLSFRKIKGVKRPHKEMDTSEVPSDNVDSFVSNV